MSATAQAAPRAADWTHGFPLEQLKAYAAVFAEQHKPLVFGAFGLTKERDIAEALHEKGLLVRRDPGTGAPAAVALLRRLRMPGRMTDVAGREITMPPGHVRCDAIAARTVEAGAALLDHMLQAHGARLWVELFEEDRIMRQAAQRLPALHWIATKVAAGSEVKGLYKAGPAPDHLAPLHPAEAVSLAVLALGFISEDEQAVVLDEIGAYAKWAQHYSTYNKRHSWTAFALRGYDRDDPTFIIKPAEMAKGWQAEHKERMGARATWTAAGDNFPATLGIVERVLDGRGADRVRLMRLAPKGELTRHADITDREAGLTDGRLARLHLPLRTSPGVIMRGVDKRGAPVATRFPERALCYLDQRGPHMVENNDPGCERVHLVLDVRSDARLRDMIAEAAGGPAALA